jgi:hypothetical protein
MAVSVMNVSVINYLEKVQHDLSKLKGDHDEELKLFLSKFETFKVYLKTNNLDTEYFDIFPYDNVKYHRLILSKGDLVFRVIDDLTGHNLSNNLDWNRCHYFLNFNTLTFTMVCCDELDHNFLPFNIHLQPDGFYLESWSVSNIINYIVNCVNSNHDFLFLPLYQDNGKQKSSLHVSLIVIEIKSKKVYHWDPNGFYSVFYDRNDSRRDIIPGLMELTISNFFNQDEFKVMGYDFTYVPQSDLQLYTFNTPVEKYNFDNGDCFIHMLLVPYLITKLKSLDNVVKFYKNMHKEFQTFLIYNFASYLVLTYDHIIASTETAHKYLNKYGNMDDSEDKVEVKENKGDNSNDFVDILTNIRNIVLDIKDVEVKNDLEKEINKLEGFFMSSY